MKTRFPAVLVLTSLLSAPAAALLSGGVDQTLGSNSYKATRLNASLDLGSAYYIAPSFSTMQSNEVPGLYHDYGLRVGYEKGPLSLGFQGDVLPKVNGYLRDRLGLDLTFSLLPGGSVHQHKIAGPGQAGDNRAMGPGLTGLDVGVAGAYVHHQDDRLAGGSSGPGLDLTGANRSAPFKLDEGDLSAFVGARFLLTELSAQVTKSVYSKALDGNQLRQAPYLALPGLSPIVQGYPDTAFNAQIKWKMLPFIHPYVSYAHTAFKLGESPSNGYEVGLSVGLSIVSVKAGYERYVQRGFPDRNNATLGASLNF